jgi:DNA-binding GntR family transcriptional regulator
MLRRVPRGRALREADWARRLGVNRSAMREAFARLQGEGWLVEGPRAGFLAPEFGRQETAELLELRWTLEAGAIERLCREKADPSRQLKPLYDLCEQLAWLLERDFLVELCEVDRRFHASLVEASGNARLLTIYNSLPPAEDATQTLHQAQWQTAANRMLQEHRAILDAVAKGDLLQAQQLLHEHLATQAGGDVQTVDEAAPATTATRDREPSGNARTASVKFPVVENRPKTRFPSRSRERANATRIPEVLRSSR